MMKIVKFNQNYKSSIEIFEESEIEREYNAYGLYFKDENFEENLKEYKSARNEYILDLFEDETPTLSEVKEAIADFQEDYSYEDSSETTQYGRPKFFLEETDEDFVSTLEGYYDAPYGNEMEDGDLEDHNDFVKWWDGSNFKKIYIYSEHGWTDTEEITDEYGDSFNRKVFIGSDKELNSTRWTNYYYDYDEKNLWAENVTCWQGERNDWDIIEDEDDIDIAFVKYGEYEIEELRPEIIEKYGENLEVLKLDFEQMYAEIPVSLSDLFEIFSKDDYESLGTWVNDPYSRTCGGEYFKHKENGTIIQYTWSAYQGDWCGYSNCMLSEEEVEEKI